MPLLPVALRERVWRSPPADAPGSRVRRGLLVVLLAASVSAARVAHAQPAPDPVALAPSAPPPAPPWRLAVRLTPPLAHALYVSTGPDPDALGLLGGALGVISPGHLWGELSASLLLGLGGPGTRLRLAAGYELGDSPREHAWQWSFPVYLSYQQLRRPASWPTDGTTGYEPLGLVGGGGRAVLTRTWTSLGVELGAGLDAGVPVWRGTIVGEPYYQDPVTRVVVEGTLTLGLVFQL